MRWVSVEVWASLHALTFFTYISEATNSLAGCLMCRHAYIFAQKHFRVNPVPAECTCTVQALIGTRNMSKPIQTSPPLAPNTAPPPLCTHPHTLTCSHTHVRLLTQSHARVPGCDLVGIRARSVVSSTTFLDGKNILFQADPASSSSSSYCTVLYCTVEDLLYSLQRQRDPG